MSVPKAHAAHDDAPKTAQAVAPKHEHVQGFSIFYPDGVLRYQCDHDGYQTAYAHEARAHNHSIGKA